MINENDAEWQRKKPDIFWSELSPCDHLVQIYENDTVFLDSLEGFIYSGIKSGEVIVFIATDGHLSAIEDRLTLRGLNINDLRQSDLYITLEAGEALEKFMVDGWPNETLFNQFITNLIKRAKGKQIRAFGEMVALLWGQGFSGATAKLEDLWNTFSNTGAFRLFCAYPKVGFTQDIKSSMRSICQKHSTILSGQEKPDQP